MKKILILMSLFVCGDLSVKASAQRVIHQLSNKDVWENLIDLDPIENSELEAYVKAYPRQFCTPVGQYSNMIMMAFDRGYENSGTIIISSLPYSSYPRFLCSFSAYRLNPIARKVGRIVRMADRDARRAGNDVRNIARGVLQRAQRYVPTAMFSMI